MSTVATALARASATRGRPQPGEAVSTCAIGVALAVAVTLLCVAGPAVLIGGAFNAGCQPTATTSAGAPARSGGPQPGEVSTCARI